MALYEFNVRQLMSGLPSDPLAALNVLVDRLEQASSEFEERDYEMACIILEKFAHDTKTLEYELAQDPNVNGWERQYELHVEQIIQSKREKEIAAEMDDLMVEYRSPGETFGYAHLSPEEKAFVRQKLKSIKEKIDASDLTPRKKNALFKRISDLEREVEMDGTRTDNALSLLLDVSLALRGAHKNVKPIIDDAKDIADTIVGRRADDEQPSLPKPDLGDVLGLPKSKE